MDRKPASEISKMEAERRKTLPDRPKPQRPEGFGQSQPTESTSGDISPQRSRPDVFVDAHAHVGRIEFTLDGLEAHVRLHAQVLDLLELSVGADASIDHVGLVIDDVQADVLAEVRLDAVEAIVVRLIEAIDNNPEIIRDLTRGVGSAVENVGKGVGSGVDKIGEGAGKGVQGIGEGAGEGVKGIGEGAGEGVKNVGEGVKRLGENTEEGVTEDVEDKEVVNEDATDKDLTQDYQKEDDHSDQSGNGEGAGNGEHRAGNGEHRAGNDSERRERRSGNSAERSERRHFEGHGGYQRR